MLHYEVPALAAIGQFGGDPALSISLDVSLGDRVPTLVHRRKIDHLVGDLTIDYLAVGAFNKTVLVNPSVGRQTIDQAYIRTLRGLDRADPTVMGWMHVAHLKPCALARQSTGTERRQPALVGDFGQGVGLVHKL